MRKCQKHRPSRTNAGGGSPVSISTWGKYFFQGVAAWEGETLRSLTVLYCETYSFQADQYWLAVLLTGGLFFVKDYLFFFPYAIWLILFSLQTLAILLPIPGELYKLNLAAALVELPSFL